MSKRVLSLLLVFALACAIAIAGAEATQEPAYERCLGIWVSDSIAVEIWREDEAIQCRAVLTDGGDESDIWEYAVCVCDAAGDTLHCFGVTRTRERFDSLLDDIEELDWSMDDMGLAELRLSEGGLLLANDALDAPVLLTRLIDTEATERNEALAYVGYWASESAALRVEDHGACYLFTVTVPTGGATSHRWSYICLYDPDGRRMASVDVSPRTVITREADSVTSEAQEDFIASDAEFILEDGNRLVCKDLVDGTETVFERSAD